MTVTYREPTTDASVKRVNVALKADETGTRMYFNSNQPGSSRNRNSGLHPEKDWWIEKVSDAVSENVKDHSACTTAIIDGLNLTEHYM